MNMVSSLRAVLGMYLVHEPEEFRIAEQFGIDQARECDEARSERLYPSLSWARRSRKALLGSG